jgi:hypothetical protein
LAYLLCARHGLSLREAAQLCCVSNTYVSAVSRLLPEQRAQLIDGSLTLSDVVNGRARNGHKRGKCPGLEELLVAASPPERAAAARSLGVALVWDQMVEPLLNERSAPARESTTTPAADSTGPDCTAEQLLEALR